MNPAPTLDYASPMPPTVERWATLVGAMRNALRNSGPWLTWPTWRSGLVVALMVLAGWSIYRLPKAYEIVLRCPYEGPYLRNGSLLYYTHERDGQPHIADLLKGTDRLLVEAGARIDWINATHDFSRLLAGGTNGVCVWDAANGKLLASIPSKSFSLDPTRYPVTAYSTPSHDAKEFFNIDQSGTIARWDISDGKTARLLKQRQLGEKYRALTPQIWGDGARVIIGSHRGAKVIDARTLDDLSINPEEEVALAREDERSWYLTDGTTVLPGGQRLVFNKDDAPYTRVKDVATGARLATMRNLMDTDMPFGARRFVSHDWRERFLVWQQVSDAPEPLITRSPRLWIMAPLAGALAWTLWRDARRRTTKPLDRRHAIIGCALVLVGAVAFTYGLAETAIKKRYWDEVTWAGGWSLWIATYAIVGMGIATGGAGWRWGAVVRMLLGAVIAFLYCTDVRRGVYAVFDEVWRPSELVPPMISAWGFLLLIGAVVLVAPSFRSPPRRVDAVAAVEGAGGI